MSVYPPRAYYFNLTPKDYNEDALKYVAANANSIDEVANRLGVSPEAVAGSMAREITRADGEDPYSAIGHSLAVWRDLKFISEKDFDRDYKNDLEKLHKNPGTFDGDFGLKQRILHPTLSDIEPGAVKILTALQIIKQYQGTSQGKLLGLDNYQLTDVKAIVADLNHANNPLSIKVAGLIVLNGQKFFADKSIDGIPWSELTKEQQDAALTAYYTIGEHAVSVDMAKNEFHPFTPGPKGGQVGPWVLFGNNYSNLNAILAMGGSLGLSVAPVPQQKPSSKYMKHAEAGSALALARKVLDALPADRHFVVDRMPNVQNAPVSKYMAKIGVAPRAVAPGASSEFLSAVYHRGSKYAAFAQGRPGSLVPEIHRAQRHIKPGLPKFSISRREMLPSVAPVAVRPTVMSTRQANAPHSTAISSVEEHDLIERNAVKQTIDKQNLRVALNNLLNAQARMPPSGPTAFDPSLTPAWAGLKLA